MSFTIAWSVHDWMSRFKFIGLYSIEVWFLPSLINVSRYNLLFRDFVKENVSQTLIDNLYWLWFFYSKDTVQTLKSDKFAMINHISYHWSLSIPPRISENQIFLDVFRGYQKRSVAWNGLIVVQIFNKTFSVKKKDVELCERFSYMKIRNLWL